MGMRSYRPTSPGRRHGTVLDFSDLTKKEPEKRLAVGKPRTGGRNNLGRLTAEHRGGGAKRLYRVVDFVRRRDGIPARVAAIEYDPNRSVRIALLSYADGAKSYILAPKDLRSGEKVEPRVGNCMPLASIPLGLEVHNVELVPGGGGQIARAAGTVAQLQAREGDYAVLSLPSGSVRKIHVRCRATIGQLGNLEHQNLEFGKAGRRRHLGRRPHVRGSAKNPVSHPHGGGEGRAGAGRPPCSATGKLAKGGKTRRPRLPSDRFILRGRKK
jgi:large subunit ribosomal protein L2